MNGGGITYRGGGGLRLGRIYLSIQ